MRGVMIKHQEVHPKLDQPGCFGCRIASVSVSASAMPTRKAQLNTLSASWDQQMKDDEAYKRLRKNGLQPRSTAGCSVLEQTDDKRFIEGNPIGWEDRHEVLADTSDTPQVVL